MPCETKYLFGSGGLPFDGSDDDDDDDDDGVFALADFPKLSPVATKQAKQTKKIGAVPVRKGTVQTSMEQLCSRGWL